MPYRWMESQSLNVLILYATKLTTLVISTKLHLRFKSIRNYVKSNWWHWCSNFSPKLPWEIRFLKINKDTQTNNIEMPSCWFWEMYQSPKAVIYVCIRSSNHIPSLCASCDSETLEDKLFVCADARWKSLYLKLLKIKCLYWKSLKQSAFEFGPYIRLEQTKIVDKP
jgi:hypothetical protein